MKKLCALLVMLSLFIPSVNSVFAADDSIITFDGDAEDFILPENNEVFNLEGINPGETRSYTLTLVNDDYREMNFYMSSRIVNELANVSSSGTAAFDFNFKIDGVDLFDGLVGGEENVGEKMMEDDILIATLAQGEKAVLEMSVRADGDSLDNTYQDATGLVQYTFSVEYDDEVTAPQQVINRIVKNVKTGDPTTLSVFGALLGGSLVGIVYLFVTRRKKEEAQDEAN